MKSVFLIVIMFCCSIVYGQSDFYTPIKKTESNFDIELLGASFSFKKEMNNNSFRYGANFGAGFILNYPSEGAKFYDVFYIQPILNINIKRIFFVETGPKAMIYYIPELNSKFTFGYSNSLFVKIGNLKIGTRLNLNYFSKSTNNFLLSAEPIILRLPIKGKKLR